MAALVKLLSPLGIAAPAVRTAISRMVRQGWLGPVRSNGSAGYQLTVRAVHRLDEAAARIYRTKRSSWSGQFDLVLLSPPPRTAGWSKVVGTLAYLGYGSLDPHTWVAPRVADEVDALLDEAGIPYERFEARPAAGEKGAARLVRRAWDLETLAAGYRQFLADQQAPMRLSGEEPDEVAYAARFRLVHAWRSFLFRDPQLPASLLPDPWPGDAAAAFFDHHAARLRPAADRYVDACLAG